MHFHAVVVCLVGFLAGFSQAQRPQNASVCDFYAQERYRANNSDTQRELIRRIVTLAFEGGSRLENVTEGLTGILRPGKFNGVDVNLMPWFDGSKSTTNVNNNPIGINWMDQGGTEPLAVYVARETDALSLNETSNQYHLFANFFVAFSRAFGCTIPYPSLPNTGGPVGLAYAHKFMNLDHNQLGYFINQITLAAQYFGFSTQDADTFRNRLNSLYNVRCAPAVSFNPSSPPQLLSLCQNPTCPLAAPVSDCAAYENLTAIAAPSASGSVSTVTTTASPTASPSSNPPPAEAASKDSDNLSKGAIAGIAIGGAAVIIFAIAAFFFVRRRRGGLPLPTESGGAPSTAGWVNQQQNQQFSNPSLSPNSPYGHLHKPPDAHHSYYSQGGPPSDMNSRMGSPEVAQNPTWHTQTPVEMALTPSDRPPVEMDGVSTGNGQQQSWQPQGGQEQSPGMGRQSETSQQPPTNTYQPYRP